MGLIDTTTTVETPERVAFRHRLAGPGQRGIAWAIDVVVQALFLLVFGLLALALGVQGELAAGVSTGAMLVVQFVVSWFYGAGFEWAFAGRTPGKALLGLRVVGDDGGPITLRDAVLRNLLRGVDGLPVGYVVGVIAIVVDPRLRRLGDLVAGTIVVAVHRPSLVDALVLDEPITDDERRALPVGVTLARSERLAIEGLLRRSRDLDAARVEELATMLAPTLRARGIEAPTSLRTMQLAWARATGRDR